MTEAKITADALRARAESEFHASEAATEPYWSGYYNGRVDALHSVAAVLDLLEVAAAMQEDEAHLPWPPAEPVEGQVYYRDGRKTVWMRGRWMWWYGDD